MFTTLLSYLSGIFLLPTLLGLASADTSDLLSGHAWSPNTGWVSVNCTNDATCSNSNYGLTVGDGGSTRNITGYAWSSNLGWLSFNASDLTGCPSGTCTARMNATTGEVSGWAKALSASAPGAQPGGWGGWVKLRGSSYGILANGVKWTGYAWGGGPTTGTGEFSPAEGGNAEVGWVSFRGYTTEDVPKIYGVDAATSTNAMGPRSISCGSNKKIAYFNEDVTWSVFVDSSLIPGPYTYEWTLPGGNALNGSRSATAVGPYTEEGVKRASVLVTANGIPYVVDCDAAAVTGSPATWYSYVIIYSEPPLVNLAAYGMIDAPTGSSFQAGVGVISFGGSNTDIVCYDGSTLDEENCNVTVETPFDNIIQVVISNTTPNTNRNDGHKIPTSPTITSLEPGVYTPVTVSNWAIPEDICVPTNGTGGCTAWARVCADFTVSPSLSWAGSVCENDETGSGCWPGDPGTYSGSGPKNCSTSWRQFSITAPPPPAPNLGVCRASPSVTRPGSTVTWSITPGSIQDGLLPFTYEWTSLTAGAENDLPTTNSDSITKEYTTFGVKRAHVKITDALDRVLELDCIGSARLQVYEEI